MYATKAEIGTVEKPKEFNKDSVRMTWPWWNKAQWNTYHWFMHVLDVYPLTPGVEPPVFPKDAKVPHMPQWTQHIWILTFSWFGFALQQVYQRFFGPMHPVGIALLYTHVYIFVLVHEVRMIRKVGYKYGYLDGEHPRDGVPDVGIGRVFWSLLKTVGGRVALFTYLTYNRDVSPLSVMVDPKWWVTTYFEIGVYGVVLDFWFYVYHRMMHDVNGLWQYHRTHHLTKHPNSTLSAYADDAQEVGDMVGVPFMTWVTMSALGFNMGFYDWWMCQQFIIYTEVMGHSGLRLHLTAASTLYWVLDFLGLELALEDHDLHHRHGYRKSSNYGKQSRVWDTLFGTTRPRQECHESNIDWDNSARMPLW